MCTNKNINRIITVITVIAVFLCFLAVGFSDKLSEALGGTAVSMEYETKLFDTDEIISINILMDEDEWNKMLSNATSEEYYSCDVVINGTKFYSVGIRPKGNTSLSSIAMNPDSDRYSLKLEFDHFVKGQTCFGLDKLILNNNYADATNMKEAIIYDMFQYLGADASLYNYAEMSLNGEYFGVYLALEAVEDSFQLRNYGTQDGELYKPDTMEMGGGNKSSGSSSKSSSDSNSNGFNFDPGNMPGGDGSFNPGDMFGGDGNFNPGNMFGGDGNFNPGDMFGGDGNSNSDGSNDNDTEGSGNGGFNFDPNNIPNGGDGSFNFDPNNIPGGGDGSFNPGSMPGGNGDFNPGNMPGGNGDFNPGNMPGGNGDFNPGNMPGGNGDFNPGNMPGGNDESNPGKITGNVGGFSLVSSTSSNTDSSSGSDFDPNNIPSNGDGSFSFDPSNMPSSGDGSFSFDPSNMPESSDGSFSFDFSNMPNMGGGNGGGGFSKSGGGANLNYTDDELDSYQTIWDSAITGTSTADRRRVVTALKNISEGNDFETYLDVDNVLKYMAVHTFSVNMDSLSGSMSHNYYLYEYDGQLNILPWDYNLSLGGMSMGSSGNASDMINDAIDTPFSGTHFFDTLLENEEYLAKYHEYLQQLVDEYVNGGRFDEVYNRIRSQIDDLVAADPTAFYNYEEYQTGAEMLYQTIKLRAESIDGQIKGTIPSTDEGQRQDSSTLIDASSIDVTAMGQFNMGGNFGSFKVRSNRNKRGSSSDEETTTEESTNSSTGSDSSSTGDSEQSSDKTKDSSERSRSGKSGFSRPGSSSKGNGSSSDNSGASDNAENNADTDSSSSDNMPDMSNFDSSNMPDMSNFNSGNMPDMGSFNPGSGSFPGSSSSQGRLSNIILYAACFVIMIAALIIIRISSRKRFKRGISNSAVS